MLRRWYDDFRTLLAKLKPTSADVLLINTGDDFALLALAAAMGQTSLPTMRIDMIFHFAIYDAERPRLSPSTVSLTVNYLHAAKLGDWLGIDLPAVAYNLTMNGAARGQAFDISEAVVTSDQTKVNFDVKNIAFKKK